MTGNSTFEYSQILAEICGELVKVTQGRIAVTEDTEMLGDLNLDSLQVMNLLLHVEDRFDISIPVNILPDVKTVKDLTLRIENLMREA